MRSRYSYYKKMKERGNTRLKVCGSVHLCLKKLENGVLRANQLRRNQYHMGEVEKALVMGLIKRYTDGYRLTEQGKVWLKGLDEARELGERTFLYPVVVSETWLEYFKWTSW